MSARHEDDLALDGRSSGTQSVLECYRCGDREAERRLFERCRERLIRRARAHPGMRPLQREHSPEDVAHEVLWRALSSGLLERFEHRGKGSLDATLATILDRTLIDMGRRLSAQKRGGDRRRIDLPAPDRPAQGGLERLAAADTTPTSQVRAQELLDLARAVLSEREHEAWRLREVEGLDSAEAGERLGISPAAVRGLLFRAQARLVRALGTERPPPGLRSQGR